MWRKRKMSLCIPNLPSNSWISCFCLLLSANEKQWQLLIFYIHPTHRTVPVFLWYSYFCCCVLFFEAGSQYVTQASLKLEVLLLLNTDIVDLDHHAQRLFVLLSVLLNKMFLPSSRPGKSCLPVRRTPQMPANSIMTCTTPLTFVLHLTGPSTVENQWRSVHSVEPVIPRSSRGKSAGSLQ